MLVFKAYKQSYVGFLMLTVFSLCFFLEKEILFSNILFTNNTRFIIAIENVTGAEHSLSAIIVIE